MVIKKKKSQVYFGIILNVQKIYNDSTKSFCICLPQFSSLGTLVRNKTSTLITVKCIPDFLNSTRFSTNVLFLIWDSVPYNSPISGVFFSIFTRLCDHFNNQDESQETEQLMYVVSWGRQRALGKSKEIWIKNRLQLILMYGYWFITYDPWNLYMWDPNNKGNRVRPYEKSLYYLCDFSLNLKLFWKIIFT